MAETDAPAADNGPLSVEAAIQQLTPQEQEAPAEAAPEPEEIEEQAAEAQPADGDDPPEEQVEAGQEEESAPAEPAIAPPKSWDAAARAEFALMPPALQKTVAAREEERDRAVSRAQTEASEARKRAEAEASGLSQYKAQLDQFLPRAQKSFGDKWANVDWVAWAAEDPAAAQVGRFQYEHEQAELARLKAVHQQTARVEFDKFLETENARLAEIAPALADPKEGPAKRQAVAAYLQSQGIQQSALNGISAVEMSIAHKAMLYDQAQAARTAPPKPKPASQPAPKPVAPAAAQGGAPQRRVTEQINNRFAQTKSVDDAVALLDARTRAR